MKNISLSKKINGLCFAVLVVTGIVTFIQFKMTNDSLIQKVRDKFQIDAEMLGTNVTTVLFERYYDVQAFASNKVFSQFSNKEEITSSLNSLVNLYGVYDLIMVVDTNGNYISSSNIDSFGIDIDTAKLQGNYADTQWFKKTMSGEFTVGKLYSGSYAEPPHFDPITSKAEDRPMYGSSFTAPIKNDKGEVIGVMTARANFKWVAKIFSSFFKGIKAQNDTVELTLVDGAGRVLFEYDPELHKTDKFKYDPEILGKHDLSDSNIAVAKMMKGGKGSEYVLHSRKKIDQLVGYAAFDPAYFFDNINWGILVRIPKIQALGSIIDNERNFLIGLLAVLVIGQFIAFIVSKFIGKSFIAESKKLTESSVISHQLSKVLFESSDSVASATVEQSAGIQESVSALSEMGSMISQTASSAKTSMDSAQKMNNKAKEGEHIMEEMMYSFRSIQEANQQLQKISSIIQEVSKKTNIINDIVFKTQLLSFNASIEAARAGQHGKGFAVVAEEVGNLAKVSGSAAKDIELMLQDSQKQVQDILSSLQEKIEKSSSVSNQAVSNFKDISNEIDVIVSQIRGITDACAQQELGVQQTSTAMSQIDVATQKNSSTAQETLGAAKKLADENTKLKDISSSLYALINGEGIINKAPVSEPHKAIIATGDSQVLNLEDSVKNFMTKRGAKDPKHQDKAS
jgi:methyl-accepting chemotaxis protein